MDWFIKKVSFHVRNDEDPFANNFYLHDRVTLSKKSLLSNLTTNRYGLFQKDDPKR